MEKTIFRISVPNGLFILPCTKGKWTLGWFLDVVEQKVFDLKAFTKCIKDIVGIPM